MIHSSIPDVRYDDDDGIATLLSLSPDQIDELPFGVIGFDDKENICIYNAPEARWAGLDKAKVMGSPMFEVVAPCMNNYLIAERFVYALANAESLDVQLDYVLTLRMRPTPCILRLLASPSSRIRFILIVRK